jgi:ABC-type nitrate/sulfonate/bicarbonate transport system substrate-binding protein
MQRSRPRKCRPPVVRGLIAVVAALALTASCSGPKDDASGQSGEGCAVAKGTTKKIVAGGLISGSYGPVYVAAGLGYYKEAGFDVEFVNASNPTDALGLLAQGRMDVYLGAGSAGMLNHVASGVNVRIAAAGGTIGTDSKYKAPSGFFVRKQLHDSGEITKPEDLKGRKVGSFGAAGSAVSYYIGLLAESAGMKLSNLELVPLDPPSAVEALKQGGVDASYLTAPFSNQSVERGIAVPLTDAKAVYGKEQAPVVMFGRNLLEDDPAAGCAFLAATMRGAEQLQGEYWKKPDVTEAFADAMKVEPSFIKENAAYNFDPKMTNDPKTIEGMQRMFGEMDLLKYDDNLTADKVFATELWQRAVDARKAKR